MLVDRSTLPAIGPDPDFAFPAQTRGLLPNGLRVRAVGLPGLPIVSVSLVVTGGSGSDPAGSEGLAALVADMVDEGTGQLDAIQVSEAIADIGGDYDVDVLADATIFSLTTLARFAERGARLLADLTGAPRLAEADFTRVRRQRLDRLRQMKDVPAAVAERAFGRLVYGTHPYAHLPIGDEAALVALTREHVADAHATAFRADRATLVVAGGLPVDDLLRLADLFAGWGTVGAPSARAALDVDTPLPSLPPVVARYVLVDRPGAAQSELRIGRLCAPRSTPDYFGLVVMNAVLGGQFISRLNLKLREERAFTYGARTAFDWHRGMSPFALHTSVHTASTATAVADVWQELQGLRGDRPVLASELEQAKASLTRGYPQGFQTVPQVARAVCQLAVHDLPDDYFSRFVPSVHAVTAGEVTRLAQTLLDPSTFTALVVGDAAVVAEPLARLGQPFQLTTAW